MADSTGQARGRGTVSVLQHWAAENSAALDHVIEAFGRRSDGIRVDDDAAHISTLRLHVKSRILRENPPDVWSDWPGLNLSPVVEAGAVADVTDLWRESDMESAYGEGPREAARFDGRYRCVPLDIYRINNLYYNTDHLARAGVDIDALAGPDDFLGLLDRLDDALEVPPMLIGAKDPFGPLQLWETFLVAYGGPATYEALLDGEARANRETVREAVAGLEAVLERVPEDTKFLASEEADARFAAGDAALFHNGTWAIGRVGATEGFDFGESWEHRPFPGTGDQFLMNMNALVPAAAADDPDAVTEFLRFAGSREGLEIFNAEVGAVPPRDDVPLDSLHPLTQRLARERERTRTLQSLTHGLGVAPDRLVECKEIAASHLADRDVAETTDRFVDALAAIGE
ncbi:ABC transporter substrate-binding protein [Halosimplex halobium]|uniref:ABC transporter substrate-binding protein n=1 Tax=Halosimplex halobium TaxID=3396618 RepID=UPI003F57F16C